MTISNSIGATAPRESNINENTSSNNDTNSNTPLVPIAPDDRKPFIIKVFSIAFSMLLVSFLWIYAVLYTENIKKFVISTPALFWVSVGLYLASFIIFLCFNKFIKKSPQSYIFLVLFTIITSYMLGAGNALYDANVIIRSTAITVGLVLGLILFAIFTPFDITKYYWYIASLSIVVIMSLLITLAIGLLTSEDYFGWNFIFSLIITIIFSVYLILDIQMIVGGKRRLYKFSKDDYVIASVAVYLDIINIFLGTRY